MRIIASGCPMTPAAAVVTVMLFVLAAEAQIDCTLFLCPEPQCDAGWESANLGEGYCCPVCEPIVCAADVMECPDGTFVSRDRLRKCEFAPCDGLIACTADVIQCPDGSYVGRDSSNNCRFSPCPCNNAPCPVPACEEGCDTFVPEGQCCEQCTPCPQILCALDYVPYIPEGECCQRCRLDIVCAADVKECPDDSFVSRDPDNNCRFFPCPDPPDEPEEPPQNTCFSGDATVRVYNRGLVPLRDVQISEYVLTQGNRYEPIYSFGHYDRNATASYLLFLPSGLETTENHFLYVRGRRGYIPASWVVVGDEFHNGDIVKEIRTVQRRGLYAPMTPSGTIVVNGVLASSYALLFRDHRISLIPYFHHWAHLMLTPLRIMKAQSQCLFPGSSCGPQLLSSPVSRLAATRHDAQQEVYNEDGLSSWVIFLIRGLQWFRSQNVPTQFVFTGIVLPNLIMLRILEVGLTMTAAATNGVMTSSANILWALMIVLTIILSSVCVQRRCFASHEHK